MLQTFMIEAPHKLGLPLPAFEGVKKAGSGDPEWLVKYAQVFLDSAHQIGLFTALAAAEAVAYLAAVSGGESHQRFLASILERQSKCPPPEDAAVPDHFPRLSLWQAASIYDDLGDKDAVRRVLAALAALGDTEAANRLDQAN